METVVQTPPSYTRGGTGPHNPGQPGPSGLSAHQQRRGQIASAGAPGCGRSRGNSGGSSSAGPSEGVGWTRKRRGSFGMSSAAGGNGPGDGRGAGGNGEIGGSSCSNFNNNNNSCSTGGNAATNNNNNNSTSYNNNRFKRRKRQHPNIVLPTKFMLGGSITDPLNLRSLENEEVNRLANQTPVASPAPAAGGGSERVEVIIPRDISDPLNLNAPEPSAASASASEETASVQQNSQRTTSSAGGNDSKRRGDNGAKPSGRGQLPTKKRRRRNRNQPQHHGRVGSYWRGGAAGGSAPSAPDSWPRLGGASDYGFAGASHGGGRGQGLRGNNNNGNSGKQLQQQQQQQQQDKTQNAMSSTSSCTGGSNSTCKSAATANNQNNANSSNNDKNIVTSNNSNNKKAGGSNNQRFRYGNYNRYYGYRNGAEADSRLPLLKRKWFENKVCLDIGCNVGHMTLSVARDQAPREIIGMDIDPALIRIARKNIRHYVHEENMQGSWFPESCAITFGPIAMARGDAAGGNGPSSRGSTNMAGADGGHASYRRGGAGAAGGSNRGEGGSHVDPPAPFPYNIFFTRGNYVLNTDDLLETQREEFDMIMCLSTSKWIQLNFGDDGLKRAFKRVFRQLRPGGRFLFEPQPLSSYHKFCTPEHRENFRQMQLKPDEFPDYLTREVGFASCKILGVGSHGAKNFQRPLYLLRKAKAEESAHESSDNGNSSNTPNSSPAGQSSGNGNNKNKSGERTEPSKDETDKGPSTSRDEAAPVNPLQPSPRRQWPAHECDTTTASI